ncbi:hypothetical protein H7100_00615 [Candidatus Saccharibacteria bacterium]|nr:hypothetical protein [Candidatus Saccharibacteria bacterium]
MDLELFVLSTEQLGLGSPDYLGYDTVCEQAEKFGLMRCPTEVGPAIRLLCDGPVRFKLIYWVIAMDQYLLQLFDGMTYCVSNLDGSNLSAISASADKIPGRQKLFVFCKRRKEAVAGEDS